MKINLSRTDDIHTKMTAELLVIKSMLSRCHPTGEDKKTLEAAIFRMDNLVKMVPTDDDAE